MSFHVHLKKILVHIVISKMLCLNFSGAQESIPHNLCSRYDNPIIWFLAPIDCSKILALSRSLLVKGVSGVMSPPPIHYTVATQVRSRMATKYGRSNGSFPRVLACSAGGPGFDSWLRHNILRCSMERM